MFGIGTPEVIVILLVALVVLGPKKLPEIARSLAKGIREFRRAVNTASNDEESDGKGQEGEPKPEPKDPAQVRTMSDQPHRSADLSDHG